MKLPAALQAPLWQWIAAVLMVALYVVLLMAAMESRNMRRGPGPLGLDHLFMIGVASTNYATKHESQVPPAAAGDPPSSWRTRLLSFLDRADLERQYQFAKPWNDPVNHPIAMQVPPEYSAGYSLPRKDERGRFYADFGMITGPGTANPPEGPWTLDAISEADGMGQTILVGECSGLRIVWTEPRDPQVGREEMGIASVTPERPTCNRLLSSGSKHVAYVLFADGSAKPLRREINLRALTALCTVGGREKLDQSDFVD